MQKKVMFTAFAGALMMSATFAGAADLPESLTLDGKTYPRTVTDKTTQKECGACHMAFAPARLTGNGWKKLMSGLEDHFGENASLPAETTKHIEDYMVANSFDAKGGFRAKLTIDTWKKKGVVDPIRLTKVPGWERDHSSDLYKQMVKDFKYDRGSDCMKCHKNAEYGLYESFGESGAPLPKPDGK
ncbi:MAG: hypothetical protein A2516_05105 [Alphaproteobacteria bacterium RIFOXYD12_FULL_60_8]|nr:MAG: hypothetical protein A2516_05105 [Alphaproteobacteria bacterium RIFOXYD12_FULL_60_8]